MCVVSNIGDYGHGIWGVPNPPPASFPWGGVPNKPWEWEPAPGQTVPADVKPYNGPTKEQFEEFLNLLRTGARFDRVAGQPHCEQDQKIAWLREIAETLGVDPTKIDDALKG